MARNYLISRQFSLSERFSVTDEAGVPQFTVQGRFTFGVRMSLRDPVGSEVATVRRAAFSRRYEIVADGHPATLRPAGLLGRRYEIDSAAGHLSASGSFSGRQYAVQRGGTTVAAVAQQRGWRERFAVEVQDEEDPVLMLAVIMTIETIRDRRREASSH